MDNTKTKKVLLNSEQFVLNTLASDAFVMVNKKFLKLFGGNCTEAILLSELLSVYKYYKIHREDLSIDGSFPASQRRIESTLGISNAKQSAALKLLAKQGLLENIVKGFPATRYIRLNFDMISEILDESLKPKKTDEKKVAFYKELNNTISICENLSALNSLDKYIALRKVAVKMNKKLFDLFYVVQNKWLFFFNKTEWSGKEMGFLSKWLGSKKYEIDYNVVQEINNKLFSIMFSYSYTQRCATLLSALHETTGLYDQIISSEDYYNKDIVPSYIKRINNIEEFYKWEKGDK